LYSDFIQVTDRVCFFKTRGFKKFNFHLSIPFYTRTRGPQVPDTRRLGAAPLRETLSIKNLGVFREAQASVILTGVDDLRWTAIGLIDSTLPTEAAHGFEPPPPPLIRDHITGVDFFNEDTESNARLYFLWLWKERVNQILRDWKDVVSAIHRSIDK
jgi:hypothetical protein